VRRYWFALVNLILIPALPEFRLRYPDIQLDLGVIDRSLNLIVEGVDCVTAFGNLLDRFRLKFRCITGMLHLTSSLPVSTLSNVY